MRESNIRNFAIISHVDHGKSTLADRFLELTGTIEKRKMREQFLDSMELERERGITIKMQPVRMIYSVNHSHRGQNADFTQKVADSTPTNADGLLYEDLTYKIRGVLFKVRKSLGLGHKEQVYHNALEIEFKNAGLRFESKKNISIMYEGKSIGMYQPDFIVEDKVLIELKALPEVAKPQMEQLWSYLKGCNYKLALLVNFGSKDLEIKRIVYDTARQSAEDRRLDAEDAEVFFLRDSASSLRMSAGVADQIENNKYILNLIDTPGHVDFSYEVSRALAAVEGAILLVDATKGVQAQTLSNLKIALEQKLTIIPVVNKIDLPQTRAEEVEKEIEDLLLSFDYAADKIFRISAKTGEGVEELLCAVVEMVPSPDVSGGPAFAPPSPGASEGHGKASAGRRTPLDGTTPSASPLRALIFDSFYDPYKGVVAHVRIKDGRVSKNDKLLFLATGLEAGIKELGYFAPDLKPTESLEEGGIGYIATGLKDVEKVKIGDTVTVVTADRRRLHADGRGNLQRDSASSLRESALEPLEGYKEPQPLVFASVFPEAGEKFNELKDAVLQLKLNDSSLYFEIDYSESLGRGIKFGFLGMLHMEIILERLKREFGIETIVTSPSVVYKVKKKDGEKISIYTPSRFPDPLYIEKTFEPYASLEILTPSRYLSGVMYLLKGVRGEHKDSETLGKDILFVRYEAPLSEIITDFYDKLKSTSSGFASLAYELIGFREGDVVKMEILLAGEEVESLARIVPKEHVYKEGKRVVEKLKEIIPKEQFAVAIQARVGGKIIARETKSAMKKDVTGYLYGGDYSRKRKLLEKQKKGKKRLREHGRVHLDSETFMKLFKQ